MIICFYENLASCKLAEDVLVEFAFSLTKVQFRVIELNSVIRVTELNLKKKFVLSTLSLSTLRYGII